VINRSEHDVARTILVIGIGPGNPEQVTVQAIAAMNRADAIYIPSKGEGKRELARVRQEICDRYIENTAYRVVGYDIPRRATVSAAVGYDTTVQDWHAAITEIYADLLNGSLADGETGAFLVWGDPSLYDSVLRILDRLSASGQAVFDLEVIPGITSVQALAAAHKIPLNDIGQPVLLTTGRRFAESEGEAPGNTVVMLDGQTAYHTADPKQEIFWGAYLGTEDEIQISGLVGDVAKDIDRCRAEARKRHGWIMDTYLLRKAVPDSKP